MQDTNSFNTSNYSKFNLDSWKKNFSRLNIFTVGYQQDPNRNHLLEQRFLVRTGNTPPLLQTAYIKGKAELARKINLRVIRHNPPLHQNGQTIYSTVVCDNPQASYGRTVISCSDIGFNPKYPNRPHSTALFDGGKKWKGMNQHTLMEPSAFLPISYHPQDVNTNSMRLPVTFCQEQGQYWIISSNGEKKPWIRSLDDIDPNNPSYTELTLLLDPNKFPDLAEVKPSDIIVGAGSRMVDNAILGTPQENLELLTDLMLNCCPYFVYTFDTQTQTGRELFLPYTEAINLIYQHTPAALRDTPPLSNQFAEARQLADKAEQLRQHMTKKRKSLVGIQQDYDETKQQITHIVECENYLIIYSIGALPPYGLNSQANTQGWSSTIRIQRTPEGLYEIDQNEYTRLNHVFANLNNFGGPCTLNDNFYFDPVRINVSPENIDDTVEMANDPVALPDASIPGFKKDGNKKYNLAEAQRHFQNTNKCHLLQTKHIRCTDEYGHIITGYGAIFIGAKPPYPQAIPCGNFWVIMLPDPVRSPETGELAFYETEELKWDHFSNWCNNLSDLGHVGPSPAALAETGKIYRNLYLEHNGFPKPDTATDELCKNIHIPSDFQVTPNIRDVSTFIQHQELSPHIFIYPNHVRFVTNEKPTDAHGVLVKDPSDPHYGKWVVCLKKTNSIVTGPNGEFLRFNGNNINSFLGLEESYITPGNSVTFAKPATDPNANYRNLYIHITDENGNKTNPHIKIMEDDEPPFLNCDTPCLGGSFNKPSIEPPLWYLTFFDQKYQLDNPIVGTNTRTNGFHNGLRTCCNAMDYITLWYINQYNLPVNQRDASFTAAHRQPIQFPWEIDGVRYTVVARPNNNNGVTFEINPLASHDVNYLMRVNIVFPHCSPTIAALDSKGKPIERCTLQAQNILMWPNNNTRPSQTLATTIGPEFNNQARYIGREVHNTSDIIADDIMFRKAYAKGVAPASQIDHDALEEELKEWENGDKYFTTGYYQIEKKIGSNRYPTTSSSGRTLPEEDLRSYSPEQRRSFIRDYLRKNNHTTQKTTTNPTADPAVSQPKPTVTSLANDHHLTLVKKAAIRIIVDAQGDEYLIVRFPDIETANKFRKLLKEHACQTYANEELPQSLPQSNEAVEVPIKLNAARKIAAGNPRSNFPTEKAQNLYKKLREFFKDYKTYNKSGEEVNMNEETYNNFLPVFFKPNAFEEYHSLNPDSNKNLRDLAKAYTKEKATNFLKQSPTPSPQANTSPTAAGNPSSTLTPPTPASPQAVEYNLGPNMPLLLNLTNTLGPITAPGGSQTAIYFDSNGMRVQVRKTLNHEAYLRFTVMENGHHINGFDIMQNKENKDYCDCYLVTDGKPDRTQRIGLIGPDRVLHTTLPDPVSHFHDKFMQPLSLSGSIMEAINQLTRQHQLGH